MSCHPVSPRIRVTHIVLLWAGAWGPVKGPGGLWFSMLSGGTGPKHFRVMKSFAPASPSTWDPLGLTACHPSGLWEGK